MANRHFGRIGDIWKHLPLAEVLRIEVPRRYWETHAGSASYPLTHSDERDYGVFHFLDHAPEDDNLRNSAYFAMLSTLAAGKELTEYPGSPQIAMSVIERQRPQYLLADIDADSLNSIRDTGKQLGISEDRLNLIAGDGLFAVDRAERSLPAVESQVTFAHLDPYRPFLKSTNDVSCIDLFARLTVRGVRTMLWYGFDADEYRDMLVGHTRESCTKHGTAEHAARIWCGEIILEACDDPAFDYNPGVLACGILCGNLSDRSQAACTRLGTGLVDIYASASLPNQRSGALRYRSEEIKL